MVVGTDAHCGSRRSLAFTPQSRSLPQSQSVALTHVCVAGFHSSRVNHSPTCQSLPHLSLTRTTPPTPAVLTCASLCVACARSIPLTGVSLSTGTAPISAVLSTRSDASLASRLRVASPEGGVVKLNVNQGGFFRVNYPAATWTALGESLFSMPASDRLGLISDAFAAFKVSGSSLLLTRPLVVVAAVLAVVLLLLRLFCVHWRCVARVVVCCFWCRL